MSKFVKAVGTNVVIEMLDANQILAPKGLILPDNGSAPDHQGIVRDIGPALKSEEWGFAVGDRVLLDGVGVDVHRYDGGKAKLGIFPPHAIKGVLDLNNLD